MRWMLIALVTASMAPAQTGSHTYQFTPMPEVTVSGTVEVVRAEGLDGCELCEACSDCRGVHVLLQTRTGRVEVHLAPAWFLQQLGFTPSTGNELTVSGTRIRLSKGRGVAAHAIQAGRTTIRLRDEHGLPLWRRVTNGTHEPACVIHECRPPAEAADVT